MDACGVVEFHLVVEGLLVEGLRVVRPHLVWGWCVGCVLGLAVALEVGPPMLQVWWLLVLSVASGRPWPPSTIAIHLTPLVALVVDSELHHLVRLLAMWWVPLAPLLPHQPLAVVGVAALRDCGVAASSNPDHPPRTPQYFGSCGAHLMSQVNVWLVG